MPIPSFLRLAAAAAIACMCAGAPANAGQIFNLTASNVSFDIPSPLFTSSQIDGFLVIADSIGPGDSFGAGQLEGFAFNIAGFSFTQADLDPNFSSIDVNGQISADGLSIPFLQIGYSLDPLFPGCSFVCAGAFNIAQFAQSNFVVADDPDATTLGLVLFDAAFDKVAVQVPEPVTLSLFAIGLVGAGALRRRQKQA
ncbi:MAG: PEP-CTERM sorting domain-containing protein [Rhizobiales bacterium]|nr:PEP-CTERM sorting domain-containing protein [Hyphomicrobiales bacterium]